MGGLAEAILEKALRALESADLALAESVRTDDLAIDQVDVDIDSAVLHLLALQAPVAEDLRRVTASKTIAIYLERVGDLSRNLAGCAGRLARSQAVPVPPTSLSSADLFEHSSAALSMRSQTRTPQKRAAFSSATMRSTSFRMSWFANRSPPSPRIRNWRLSEST